MREPSLPFAAVTSRRQELERAVEAYAADLFRRHPEVVDVIWFGSWVTGQPSRRSDVDLCILLSHSSIGRIRDRIPIYLPDRFPTGVDLFPYTREEFDALKARSPSWYTAISEGKRITRRD